MREKTSSVRIRSFTVDLTLTALCTVQKLNVKTQTNRTGLRSFSSEIYGNVNSKENSFCDLKCCLRIDERPERMGKKTQHLLNVSTMNVTPPAFALCYDRQHSIVMTAVEKLWRLNDSRSSVSTSQPFSKPSGWMSCFALEKFQIERRRRQSHFVRNIPAPLRTNPARLEIIILSVQSVQDVINAVRGLCSINSCFT